MIAQATIQNWVNSILNCLKNVAKKAQETFYFSVAEGNITNYESGFISGRNPDVASAPDDIWGGAAPYTGQNSEVETVEVLSDDATDDDGLGTGAQEIEITGLLSATATEYTTEIIATDGLTPVASTNTYWRVIKARVVSGVDNVGTITVRHTTTTANVFAVILPGENVSGVGAYTVPAGKTMFINKLLLEMARDNGAAGKAYITMRVRESGAAVYSTPIKVDIDTSDSFSWDFNSPWLLAAGTDLKFTVESITGANPAVNVLLGYVLKTNE